MYGANFDVNDGNTTYFWRPGNGNTYVNGNVAIHPGANKIFATIWDGGGSHDKYNLSAYDNNVYVDLRPGACSTFKQSQLADLDASSNLRSRIAGGNIYNALQYQGDNRSLIEDAVGGDGNDLISGNHGKNRLVGNDGNDRFLGREGVDVLIGGAGSDTFFFRVGWGTDTIGDFAGNDRINLTSFDFSNFSQVLAISQDSGNNVVLSFGNGDNLILKNTEIADLHASDFIL
nr:hypothetical protein [Rhizobium setariae]